MRLYHKTFKAWLKSALSVQELQDLARHGADAGWPNLTYTQDTVKLFDRYGDEIWNLAQEQAEALGLANVPALVTTFRRADMAETLDNFKNLMVWFAAEEYAREYLDD